MIVWFGGFQAKKIIEHNRNKERRKEEKEIRERKERVRQAQEAQKRAAEEQKVVGFLNN